MAAREEAALARLRAELDKNRTELAELSEEAAHPPEVELGGGSAGYSTWQAAVVIRQHYENIIESLLRAIKRVEEGLYFNCEVCGAEIPEERLELIPWATMCVRCTQQANGVILDD
jgi:DnaK suppressor protein